jgi:uncharacterized SAM-binding protein YcdF (DUF218 family)
MTSQVDTYAKVIWDYMLMGQPLKKSDAIFVLCSIDERVAEYGAQLFLDGYGDWLIFSGGVAHIGDLMQTNYDTSEAEHFAAIATRVGVPKENIIVENKATNTGENITFMHELLKQRGIQIASFVLVQKPYMERRTYATFMKQWPDQNTEIAVSSPPISYDQYFNKVNSKDRVINIMVGDLKRMRDYPGLGFQIEQDIPSTVWDAYNALVALGYTKSLPK